MTAACRGRQGWARSVLGALGVLAFGITGCEDTAKAPAAGTASRFQGVSKQVSEPEIAKFCDKSFAAKSAEAPKYQPAPTRPLPGGANAEPSGEGWRWVNAWATWCTPCRREMPLLSSMQREHADDGLVVLYVSLEDPQVLDSFLATHRFDGVQGRLDRAADYYDAGKFYPLSYLISRDGRVTQRWSGRPQEDWLRTEVARALRDPYVVQDLPPRDLN